MNDGRDRTLSLLALGLVDTRGVVGSALPASEWPTGRDPLRGSGIFKRLFGRVDPTFRRLDRLSRALVLATEATGIGTLLDEDARRDTAIVFETQRGCLESDVAFASGLASDKVLGPLFPYTLPSTPLGELALRHALRGPTLCLSCGSSQATDFGRAALNEAAALITAGEARFVLVASAEVLELARGAATPALLAIVALCAARDDGRGTPLRREAASLSALAATLRSN